MNLNPTDCEIPQMDAQKMKKIPTTFLLQQAIETLEEMIVELPIRVAQGRITVEEKLHRLDCQAEIVQHFTRLLEVENRLRYTPNEIKEFVTDGAVH